MYMAEFILARRSRNAVSNLLHVILNILLAFTAVFSVVVLRSPIMGVLLVTLSKWRVLAVRTRFWWPNIKANLVDYLVGLSVVFLVYFVFVTNSEAAGTDLASVLAYLGFAILYGVWLLIIKPLSSENAALVQSLIAVFLGISATAIGTATLNAGALPLVLLAFVIGFAASRHILSQSNDHDFTLTTLVCGLTFAEIAWLCYSWDIVYPLGSVRVPQMALILTIFTFVYNYTRQAMIKYRDDFRFKQILLPVIFGIALVAIIVLGYSDPMFNV